MEVSNFKLGPLTLSVQGEPDKPVFSAIRDELSVLDTVEIDGTADVTFRFVSTLDEPRHTLHVGRWRLAEDTVVGQGGGYRFCMRAVDDGFDVQVATDRQQKAVTDHYERAWDWNFLAPWETTAKNFMYDLFDLVTAAALLERDASYLHASTCMKGDDAVALVAWGGIGKTTSVLKLVCEDDWQFLSDDLGLIDAEQTIFRTPRRLQVYAYNVAGQPDLAQRVMEGRGPIDRVNWHWRLMRFGPKRVRRRIGADELFGPELVGDSAPIKKAIFLERADVSDMQWTDLDSGELAHRSATILVDELNTLFDVSVAAESHGIDVGIAGFEELRQASRTIQQRAFADVPAEILSIPVDAGPDALAAALRDHLPK